MSQCVVGYSEWARYSLGHVSHGTERSHASRSLLFPMACGNEYAVQRVDTSRVPLAEAHGCAIG